MEIHPDVVAAVGNTPLIRLSRIHPAGNLVAKLESTNPGGSVKERIAISMIDEAEQAGLLEPGGTIIEPTSGNTGVGLAMIGAVRGYRVICTVPDKVSQGEARPAQGIRGGGGRHPYRSPPRAPRLLLRGRQALGVGDRRGVPPRPVLESSQSESPLPDDRARDLGADRGHRRRRGDRGRDRGHHLRSQPLSQRAKALDRGRRRRPPRVDLHRRRHFPGAPIRGGGGWRGLLSRRPSTST